MQIRDAQYQSAQYAPGNETNQKAMKEELDLPHKHVVFFGGGGDVTITCRHSNRLKHHGSKSVVSSHMILT